MAKSKAEKKKKAQKSKATPVKETPPGGGMYAARETIESIVIAFVLAFLFRTFEAEAFVIPTGSMSPSLQGQHKDVCCTECGYRFRTSASTEGNEKQQALAEGNLRKAYGFDVVLGMCPMCRQTMAMRPDLPSGVQQYISIADVEHQRSYPGDRILVNKYCYHNSDPERWDVVVFKFPGNGEMNYIKRLIGLPGETLQIFQGDIFTRSGTQGGPFKIQRKPPTKVRAMLQEVHDTDYDPNILYNAGWPLRWEPDTPDGWQVEAKPGDQTVQQQFKIQPNDNELSWLQYRNYVPQQNDWRVARKFADTGKHIGISKEEWQEEIRPELIRDFNPYNASRLRIQVENGNWTMPDDRFNMHWVSDLAVECEVDVEQTQGELHLDLVEAGKHFTCRIDLKTGLATLGVAGVSSISAEVETPVKAKGSYRLLFANIDDQLLLWVDDELMEVSSESAALLYDADEVFGDRRYLAPKTSESDPGDLAPVRVGAQGASLTVNRLRVLRDIYYIATKSAPKSMDYPDYKFATKDPQTDERIPGVQSLRELFTEPAAWPRFAGRQKVEFTIKEKQLFVMGDNSPASQDCRLWAAKNTKDGSKPGGSYLDRRLLIGKAVCVFWPHSWGEIPGASKLPGFPNFGDMRLVR